MTRNTADIRTALDALAAVADQDVEATPGQRAYIAGAVSALRWTLREPDPSSQLIPGDPLV